MYLLKVNLLMYLVLLKVMDMKVLLIDMVLKNYKEKHIEVLEKLLVLVHGIHQEFNLLLPELVKMDITIELNWIKEFTE